jgi:hypothetical protein
MVRSLLIGRLVDGPAEESSRRGPIRALLESGLRVRALLDIQLDHEAPEPQRSLFRFQAYLHFRQEHLPQLLDLAGRLEPEGPLAPDLDGVSDDWSPAMRRADWSELAEVDRLGLPDQAEAHLARALRLTDEFVEATIRALEPREDPPSLRSRLWEALGRWADSARLGSPFTTAPPR